MTFGTYLYSKRTILLYDKSYFLQRLQSRPCPQLIHNHGSMKQPMMFRCDVTPPPIQQPTDAGAPRPRLSPRGATPQRNRCASLTAANSRAGRFDQCFVFTLTSAFEIRLSLRKQFLFFYSTF